MVIYIIYSTKHGGTGRVAEVLERMYEGHTVKKYQLPYRGNMRLDRADVILIGSPVYFGRPMRSFQKFVSKNVFMLKKRPLGIFLSGMNNSAVRKALKDQISPDLLFHAFAAVTCGGTISWSSLSVFEKLVVSMVSGIRGDKDLLDPVSLSALRYNKHENNEPGAD